MIGREFYSPGMGYVSVRRYCDGNLARIQSLDAESPVSSVCASIFLGQRVRGEYPPDKVFRGPMVMPT